MNLAHRLRRTLDRLPDRDTLSGAIRISRNGSVVFQQAYGQASAQLRVPNTLGSRFHIASMTKMFIAAAVVKLSQQGALSLRAHPAEYVPELESLHPNVTLHG